jgi:hypothetical protein
MPHRLVSKKRVDKLWNPRLKQFFEDYCWPLSRDLWVMWDQEPDSWKPINHSCDPNAWVTGLDLVARKNIKKGKYLYILKLYFCFPPFFFGICEFIVYWNLGEEITMDYATMYAGEFGPKFECKCGSKECRGGFKPGDYLEDWFRERYGDHVTDFVRQERRIADLLRDNNNSNNNKL